MAARDTATVEGEDRKGIDRVLRTPEPAVGGDRAARPGAGRSRRGGGGASTGLGASALGAAAAAVLALIVLACWRRIQHQWSSTVAPETIEVAQGLELLTLAAAGVVAAWLGVLLLLGAVAALPGRSTAPLRAVAERLAPRLAPRVAASLIAAAVALTPVGAAQASSFPASPAATSAGVPSGHAAPPLSAVLTESTLPAESPSEGAPTRHTARTPDPESTRAPEPGWRPTAPLAAPDPEAISLVSRGTAEPDVVVVRSGDTLWHIAARHLGEDADAAAIAEAWPRWHDANRAVIGSDPDYLLPGTRLAPPAAHSDQEQVAP